MPAIINDRRSDTTDPWMYVVYLDTFMSGWGQAPGRSYYCLAVHSEEQARIVEANGACRSEMTKPRRLTHPPKGAEGDHVSITDEHEAARWYEPGGFAS